MSFLTALFSAPKAVDTAIDVGGKAANGIIQGFDHLFYGDQEKAEFSIEVGKQVLDFVKATLGENTLRSMSRRIIAVAITGQVLLLSNIGVVLLFMKDKERFSSILELLKVWWGPFLAVVIFYFGYYGFMRIFGKDK